MKVIGTKHQKFIDYRDKHKSNTGAYFYGKEIEENILPHMSDIDVTVVTAGASLHRPEDLGKAVIVCHANRSPAQEYILHMNKGMLWICSKQSTVKMLRNIGELAVYIPLSIDIEYVKQFKAEKTKDIAFVGNAWSFKESYLRSLPKNIDQLNGMGREDLLHEMAKYKRVIAEGRCLMEAQVLGAKTEVPKYELGLEAVYVEALDNRDTIEYWRLALSTFADTQKREG